MNLFEIVFLDVILLIFPILVFLIYLSTNRSINQKEKNIYLILTIITSFFITINHGVNVPKILPLLVLNSLVIFSYLEDRYIIANVIGILIILIYFNKFSYTYMLIFIYVFTGILYIIKHLKNIKMTYFIELFIFVSSLIYYVWVYKYNYVYYDFKMLIFIIISYFFIANIVCFMYEIGKSIMNKHMIFKDLQKEKDIRLSLFKITHEIKNPIAVCKGYLDMINLNDSKQVKRYIPIIKSEIERLLSLLQDYLLINKSNLILDIMDFNFLIEDTISKFDAIIKEKNIEIKLQILDDEIFIKGDYNKLSQVLINILKNSVEAIPKDKEGIIKIYSKIKGDKYVIYIEDNGIGMDKETLFKIKEPFFTTKQRGTGLGVALITEIIEAHNGSITYESEFGKWTRVKLLLPLYE